MVFQPCYRLLVTVDKLVDLLFPFFRRFPDLKPDEQAFKHERQLQDHFRKKHDSQNKDYKDHIKCQP